MASVTSDVAKGVADLRLLVEAYPRCANNEAMITIDDFAIIDDPFESDDRFFLSVEAPMPNGAYSRACWRV